MKIVTINLNGIRSANKKGFFNWLAKENPDVICMQELRAHDCHLLEPQFDLQGYHTHYHYAEKKGYSGTAVFSKIKPTEVKIGLGWETADREGRYVAVNFGKLWVASLYMPSGTSGEARQAIKFDFLDKFSSFLKSRNKDEEYIICGDFNIAHKQVDLKNWRSNQKNSGFLPEERQWMDSLFEHHGFVDAFRIVNQEADQYTWWSNRGQAYAKNVGWRIDYQVVTPGLLPTIKSAKIFKEQRFSDHAPLVMEYDIIVQP